MAGLALRWLDQRLVKTEDELKRDGLSRPEANAKNNFHRSPGLN